MLSNILYVSSMFDNKTQRPYEPYEIAEIPKEVTYVIVMIEADKKQWSVRWKWNRDQLV